MRCIELRRIRKSSLLYICVFALTFGLQAEVHGDYLDHLAKPKVDIRIIDAKGHLISAQWNQEFRWNWKTVKVRVSTPEKSEGNKPQTSILEMEIPIPIAYLQLPKRTRITKINKKSGVVQNPKESPFALFEADNISIPLDAGFKSYSISIVEDVGKKKVQRKINVLFELDQKKTMTYFTPTCKDSNITIEEMGDEKTSPPYLILDCEKISETPKDPDALIETFYSGVRINLYHPHTIKLVKLNTKKKPIRRKGWSQFELHRSFKQNKEMKLTRGFLLKNTQSGSVYKYKVTWTPGTNEFKTFRWNTGVSTTYLHYTENPLNVDLTELAVTLNLGASLYIYRDVIDIRAKIFGNLVSYYKTPASTSQVRFYGINGRVAYKLPIRSKVIQTHTMLGIYIWGMIVPGAQFGIKQLAGPQILQSIFINTGSGHPYWFYIKFAPLADGFSLSLTHRELAAGGGYVISSPLNDWSWALTLDIADFQYDPDTLKNDISLLSLSMGLQVGI